MLKYTMQNIRQNGSESPLIFTRTVIEPANNISSQPNSSAFLRLFPLMLNIFMICILCSKAQRKFSWGRFKISKSKVALALFTLTVQLYVSEVKYD